MRLSGLVRGVLCIGDQLRRVAQPVGRMHPGLGMTGAQCRVGILEGEIGFARVHAHIQRVVVVHELNAARVARRIESRESRAGAHGRQRAGRGRRVQLIAFTARGVDGQRRVAVQMPYGIRTVQFEGRQRVMILREAGPDRDAFCDDEFPVHAVHQVPRAAVIDLIGNTDRYRVEIFIHAGHGLAEYDAARERLEVIVGVACQHLPAQYDGRLIAIAHQQFDEFGIGHGVGLRYGVRPRNATPRLLVDELMRRLHGAEHVQFHLRRLVMRRQSREGACIAPEPRLIRRRQGLKVAIEEMALILIEPQIQLAGAARVIVDDRRIARNREILVRIHIGKEALRIDLIGIESRREQYIIEDGAFHEARRAALDAPKGSAVRRVASPVLQTILEANLAQRRRIRILGDVLEGHAGFDDADGDQRAQLRHEAELALHPHGSARHPQQRLTGTDG